MAIYLVSAFSYLFIGRLLHSNQHKKFMAWSLFVLSFLMFAFRDQHVGVDTPVYCGAYRSIAKASWNKISLYRYEVGFSAFCKLLSYITKEPQFLLAISGLIICGAISRFIYKYSCDIAISGYLWILLCMPDAMNIMRGYLAFAFLTFAIDALVEDKKLKFILFVLIAASFHTVAFSAFILLLIPINTDESYKIRLMKWIPLILGAFIFYSVIFKVVVVLFPQYLYYQTSVWGSSNFFGSFLNVLTYGLLWLIGSLFMRKDRNDGIEIERTKGTLFCCMGIATLCCFLTVQMKIFNRLAVLFTPMYMIWTPLFLRDISNVKVQKILRLCIEIAVLIVFLTIAYFRPEWSGAFPYRFMKF